MNAMECFIKDKLQNGSIEEKIFLCKMKTQTGMESWEMISNTVKALQDKGLSHVEIKGAFEFARDVYGL